MSSFAETRRATGSLYARLACVLFGHLIHHAPFPVCRCGRSILPIDGRETRIRHIVSCFLFGHRYAYYVTRNQHDEYACTVCGHPLLFPIGSNPYKHASGFSKKVRYLCNLFGHSVHTVGPRDDFVEYACDCGHSFLKKEAGCKEVKHPPICLFAGHFVSVSRQEAGMREFRCSNCGHTFLLGLGNVA